MDKSEISCKSDWNGWRIISNKFPIIAKDLFPRYIWIVDTIYRAGKITFEEINERWLCNELSEGKKLPLRTFHNHRTAIEELFDINIECDKCNGYTYFIENKDDMEKGGVRSWLLNTFAVNNLINESHKLKHRILFEQIPSGQQYLTPIIEAMRDELTLEITYRSFWRDEPSNFEINVSYFSTLENDFCFLCHLHWILKKIALYLHWILKK